MPTISPPRVTDQLTETMLGEKRLPGTLTSYWQRWIDSVYQILVGAIATLTQRNLTVVSATGDITIADAGKIILCTGTITITLPDPTTCPGYFFYFFNYDVGVITIATAASTINGIATYSLAATYDYVEVTSTGTEWIVTTNN